MPDYIVMVPGTGDARPVAGRVKWWEENSPFQVRLRELVSSHDGSPLQFKLYRWSGENSETARRHAGHKLMDDLPRYELRGRFVSGLFAPTANERLLEDLLALKPEDRRYHLLGHSHGGSVIHHALLSYPMFIWPQDGRSKSFFLRLFRLRLLLSRTPSSLRGLRSWTTVGTPFITTRYPDTSLRLISAEYLPLVMFAAMLFGVWCFTFRFDNLGASSQLLAYVFLISIFIAAGITYPIWIGFRSAHQTLSDRFSARALILFHKDDEAITGLNSASKTPVHPIDKVTTRIYGSYIVTALVCLIAGFVILAENGILGVGPLFGGIDHSELPSASLLAEKHGTIGNIIAAGTALYSRIVDFLSSQNVHSQNFNIWMPGLLLLAVGIVVYPVTWPIVRRASDGISRAANETFDRKLKRYIFGLDAPGEQPNGAGSVPMKFESRFGQLHEKVGSAIEQNTLKHAGETLSAVRNLLGAASEGSTAISTATLNSSPSLWRALIHTTYFDSDEFIRLLAIGLIEVGGLKPKPEFAESDEYRQAREWLASMRKLDPNPAAGN